MDLDLDLDVDMDRLVRGQLSIHNIQRIALYLCMSKSTSKSKSRSRTKGYGVSRQELAIPTLRFMNHPG